MTSASSTRRTRKPGKVKGSSPGLLPADVLRRVVDGLFGGGAPGLCAGHCIGEAVSLVELLEGKKVKKMIWGDNVAAISIITTPASARRSRHVRCRVGLTKPEFEKGMGVEVFEVKKEESDGRSCGMAGGE